MASSSPLPSPGAIFGSQTSWQTPKKFKTANIQRDGFSGLNRKRSLLGTKIGAENVPLRPQKLGEEALKALSPKRFKSTSIVGLKGADTTNITMDKEDPIHDEDTSGARTTTIKRAATPIALKRINSRPSGAVSSEVNAPHLQTNYGGTECKERVSRQHDDPFELPKSSPPVEETAAIQERARNTPRARQPFSPLNTEMAVSRRINWTPTKDAVEAADDASPSIGLSRSFYGGLLGSFGYHGDTAVITPASCHEIDTVPTKRRRIDIIETSFSLKLPPPETTRPKKAKAAPKKALTITGLATSNYFGRDADEREHSILDQFLSTQARALEADHDDITSEVAKVKDAKKQRLSKKNPKKSTLVSPASAIKALEKQDTLFGSASQLARDESPTLMRDILEAIRQSESYTFSSPLRTQETEQISIKSTTPRAECGVARFTKKRGLWAAAGRDEDNALLHDDVFDINTFDTPGLRYAFAGKDAQVQPSAGRIRKPISPEKESPSLLGGIVRQLDTDAVWDIDQLETPTGPIRAFSLPRMQMRALHTTDGVENPRKRAFPVPVPRSISADKAGSPAQKPSKRTPKKPAFAGLTTEKLQKQIAAYGFKPMKKRERMIEVLEKCWDAKHVAAEQAPPAPAEPATENAEDPLKHGDHLSNVHGLASRHVPKEKNAPKPRKSKETKEPKEPKEPKPRKKCEPKVANEIYPDTPKVVRKQKSKAALSEEKIIDFDDVESAGEAALTTTADTDVTNIKPKKKTTAKTKATTLAKATSKATAKRAATPPVASQAPASSSAFCPFMPLSEESSTKSSGETNIDAQIELAITSFLAPATTNHQRDPTWHEKILLYDPIVLEDLAVWLNTEGLGKIGEDREVSALEVRDWCERRGVCCLWRGGWKGNKEVKE